MSTTLTSFPGARVQRSNERSSFWTASSTFDRSVRLPDLIISHRQFLHRRRRVVWRHRSRETSPVRQCQRHRRPLSPARGGRLLGYIRRIDWFNVPCTARYIRPRRGYNRRRKNCSRSRIEVRPKQKRFQSSLELAVRSCRRDDGKPFHTVENPDHKAYSWYYW